ncbi:MAG: type II toxin-antitoxin system RelB/DinJ family antitoxin [Acidaminococcaceae bacterium]|jgi:addiction module RelB/DinJ family antitoxin|nr:type II toxin-antitoxin system RelB/DinJ family antitoxin [Acidaminococcaceae bacterium]
MATKTANVLARVEPEIKNQAEAVLSQLGIPASIVINMLYKQIILTKSIPFSISIPPKPLAKDEMSKEEFHAMLQKGFQEAKAGKGILAKEYFENLK